jgi:hypothetical protein
MVLVEWDADEKNIFHFLVTRIPGSAGSRGGGDEKGIRANDLRLH